MHKSKNVFLSCKTYLIRAFQVIYDRSSKDLKIVPEKNASKEIWNLILEYFISASKVSYY